MAIDSQPDQLISAQAKVGIDRAALRHIADLSRSRGLTVLLIAHDANPRLPFVDRVLYVAHGRLALGTPQELINSEALSKLYGAPIEVLKDSRGRVVVLGLEDETAHPHGHEDLGA